MNQALPNNISGFRRLNFSSFGAEKEIILPTPKIEEILPAQEEINIYEEQINLLKQAHAADLAAAVNSAREEGYKNGYVAGEQKLDAGIAAREEAIKNILEVISNRITLAAEEHKGYLARQQDTVRDLSLTIARKIAGDALAKSPYSYVDKAIGESLALIVGEAKITINVSGGLLEGLKQRVDVIKELLRDFKGEIEVRADAEIADYDCVVEWKNGRLQYGQSELWNQIEAILEAEKASAN